MPRRYGKGRRRGRRAGKKRYSASRRALADKRINTLFEKRAEEIAKKEIAKDRINLVLRRQINAYNPVTNLFTVPALKLTYDGWGPLVIENNLRMRVSESLAGGGAPVFANDPYTVDDEVIYPMVYPFNTALPVMPINGTRATDEIKIDSIFVKIRAHIKESTANAYTNKISATFALFRVTKDYTVSTTLPTVRELFAAGRYRPWNYSSKIDTPTQELLGEPWKIRKLAEKTTFFVSDDRYPKTTFLSMAWKPKSSVSHKFIEGRSNGDSLQHRYLFAARCSTPNVVDAVVVDCQPQFHACVFLNYHE